ncbi:hypothetical protein BKA65DRAFT_46677 [Rhexocercosporidium sp. MPI-PUGE-AT-0058]|nr:hypothetical protein BKA65DRAFT_46677 [Rhexocercosporidium sp. MPI-PUGE-AT-0058]
MANPISDDMTAISYTKAYLKDFFEAEPLIPARLTELFNARLAVRLFYIYQLSISSIQLTYSLRYTLLPIVPMFMIFFTAIFFTPPKHPLYTIYIPGSRLQAGETMCSPLIPGEIAWRRSLQYKWPISGWIEVKPVRWTMVGCVVVHEFSPRWRSSGLSSEEIRETNVKIRARNIEMREMSWVRRKFGEMMAEFSYIGTGARFMIFGGLLLICMAVL